MFYQICVRMGHKNNNQHRFRRSVAPLFALRFTIESVEPPQNRIQQESDNWLTITLGFHQFSRGFFRIFLQESTINIYQPIIYIYINQLCWIVDGFFQVV